MNARPLDPLALMYHELRAPLGLVATAARSMADDAADDALRARCEMIVRATERMLRTAETVVDLAGEPDAEDSSNFYPVPVVTDLAATLAGLGVHVDPRVEVDRSLTAAGSASRFEALVHSLISNALDHGNQGAVVSVTIRQSQGSFVVDVTNAVASEDAHRGRGLGTIIAGALARGLEAKLETFIAAGHHTARIILANPVQQSGSPQRSLPSRQSA